MLTQYRQHHDIDAVNDANEVGQGTDVNMI